MNRPIWGRPLKRSLRYAALAGVLAGFGRGNADAALPAGNGMSSLELSTSRPPRNASGELPDPLASMIGKPFAKWINGKMTGTLYPDWSKEQTRDRKCKGSTKCDNGDDVTKVAIAASTDANDINIDNLQKDRVAVRMHVTKKLFGHRPDESKYGLSGRGLLYYLVVQPWPNDPNHPNPNPAGKPAAQWSLVKVDGDQSEIVASGMFQRCCTQSDPQSDPEHCIRPKPSYGDFKDCNTSHRQYSETFLQFQNARSDAEEKQAEARLASLASGSLTASAWVSCSHGCCIAGPK